MTTAPDEAYLPPGLRSVALIAGVLCLSSGCASIATSALADAMSASGGGYGQDDDPELVAAAAPFGLKTMESVLEQKPEHRGLLTALAGGFTQYGFAFVDLPGQALGDRDVDLGLAAKRRARKLYLRARNYGLRGLEVEHEGLSAALRADAKAALAETTVEDVPLLYWTAASWGLAISASKNEPALIGDLPLVLAIATRALELDEDFNGGALHELFVSLEAAVPGGSLERAEAHYKRALELSGGVKAGPYVSFAESVCVKRQDSKMFHALIDKALAIEIEASPNDRLANTLMQRKARRLKAMSEDLFLDDVGAE